MGTQGVMKTFLSEPLYWVYAAIRWHWRDILKITLVIWGILILALAAANALGATDADRFDQEENALWQLINDYRQENAVQPVGLNDQLMDAAAWMSNDMATNDRYSHIDSLGRSARERMANSGYGYNTWTGENLAAGMATAQEALDAWKGSPKHDANMLSPYFWAVGIARYYDEDSAYGWYWTVDFGGRGPAWFPSAPMPTPISVPPTGPHGDETPTPIPVPATLPSTGTNPY